MRETQLNKFIHSRAALSLLALPAMAFAYFLSIRGCSSVTGETGFFNGAESWLPPGTGSWIANSLLVAVAGATLYALNKAFAFIREYTIIHLTVFLFATFINPAVSASLNSSTFLAAILAVCTFVLFTNFQQADRRGPLFLIAAILSAGSLACRPCLYYLPVFMAGMMEMRVFSFRGFLAVAAGAAFPYWLCYAFGVADIASMQLSDFDLSTDTFRTAVKSLDFIHAAYLIIVGTILGLSNILTIISYRLQLRAYNAFLNIMALATTLLIVLDAAHATAYIVTLNLLIAVQAAHFFTIRRFRRIYAVFFLLVAVETALAVAVAFNFAHL